MRTWEAKGFPIPAAKPSHGRTATEIHKRIRQFPALLMTFS